MNHTLSCEEILNMTDIFFERYGRHANKGEHKNSNGLPGVDTIRKYFQMSCSEFWDTFYPMKEKKTKPRPIVNSKYTKESTLNAIRQFIDKHGHLPTSRNFEEEASLPSRPILYKLFDGKTLDEIYEQWFPVVQRGNRFNWDREKIVSSIQQFYSIHKRLPRVSECNSNNALPSFKTIKTYFLVESIAEFYDKYFEEIRNEKREEQRRKIIELIKSYEEKQGYLPRTTDFCKENNLPYLSVLYKCFHGLTINEIYEQWLPNYAARPKKK